MTEVGGYQLHLYCDNPDCVSWKENIKMEFGGPNGRYARREARKSGWSLRRTTLCPTCNPNWATQEETP